MRVERKNTARNRNRETKVVECPTRLLSVGFDSKAITQIQVIA